MDSSNGVITKEPLFGKFAITAFAWVVAASFAVGISWASSENKNEEQDKKIDALINNQIEMTKVITQNSKEIAVTDKRIEALEDNMKEIKEGIKDIQRKLNN